MLVIMKLSQILRQRYTSCLSGMGLTSTKKSGDTKGAIGLGTPKAHADEKAEQKRTEKKIMESSFPLYFVMSLCCDL